MKKFGNRLLKVVLIIDITLIIALLPSMFLFDDILTLNDFFPTKMWINLIIAFGALALILLLLGCRPDESKNKSKNSKLKEVYSLYGPVVMRVSIVLCILFLLSIVIWCFIIKDQSVFEITVKVSFYTSMFFGILSFILLLFCIPKESSSSEVYQMKFNDFTEYNKFMESVFLKNKFKKHNVTETKQGCEIYVYKGRTITSINYYFIINLMDLSDKSSLVELDDFVNKVLHSENMLNLGTVKASSIICVDKRTNDFEENLIERSNGYKLWTTLSIGVVFDEQKVYLPSCKEKVRVSLMKTMKREFRELVGISEPVSKNLLIRWIIGNSKEKVNLLDEDS